MITESQKKLDELYDKINNAIGVRPEVKTAMLKIILEINRLHSVIAMLQKQIAALRGQP